MTEEYRTLSTATERSDQIHNLISALRGRGESLKYVFQSMAMDLEELSRSDEELLSAKDLAWDIQANTEALQEELENYASLIVIDPSVWRKSMKYFLYFMT